jgi:hypothetical protein
VAATLPLDELIRGRNACAERTSADERRAAAARHAGRVARLAAACCRPTCSIARRARPFVASRRSPDDDVSLGEVVIGTDSAWSAARSIEARFAERFHVVVVGLKRGTEQILRDGRPIGEVPLAAGDVLLVQGRNEAPRRLKAESAPADARQQPAAAALAAAHGARC